jgi:hypothetical protein
MSCNYTPGWGGRGSEIVVRKFRVYGNGMLWLRERLLSTLA